MGPSSSSWDISCSFLITRRKCCSSYESKDRCCVSTISESYTFGQMLKQPDDADFIHAMIKEADDHESRDHWDVVPRWENPSDVKAILAIWDFKKKRFPDGRINKNKAQLCAHGGIQQYGVNYWETY